MAEDQVFASFSSGSKVQSNLTAPTNDTSHDTRSQFTLVEKKYKIRVSNELTLLPALVLCFQVVDVGVLWSNGAFDVETLVFVGPGTKLSGLDVGLLVFTEGIGNGIKTAVEYVENAEKIRHIAQLLSQAADTNWKPKMENGKPLEWDKWEEFDRKNTAFTKPSDLYGAGLVLGNEQKIGIVPGWLSVGRKQTIADFYGTPATLRFLWSAGPLGTMLTLVSEIHSPPRVIATAKGTEWSAKCPALISTKAAWKKDRSALVDIDLGDFLADIVFRSGGGIWFPGTVAAKIVETIGQWIKFIADKIAHKFDEFILALTHVPPEDVHTARITQLDNGTLIDEDHPSQLNPGAHQIMLLDEKPSGIRLPFSK